MFLLQSPVAKRPGTVEDQSRAKPSVYNEWGCFLWLGSQMHSFQTYTLALDTETLIMNMNLDLQEPPCRTQTAGADGDQVRGIHHTVSVPGDH